MLGLLYRAADALRRKPLAGNNGRLGEDMAHGYLRRQRCIVAARNYRPPPGGGEIDIVAWEGSTLVFVEVKTRAVEDFGTPDRAVDIEKQRRVTRAARDYARRSGVDWEQTRFDIISIVLSRPPKIEWIRDAWKR